MARLQAHFPEPQLVGQGWQGTLSARRRDRISVPTNKTSHRCTCTRALNKPPTSSHDALCPCHQGHSHPFPGLGSQLQGPAGCHQTWPDLTLFTTLVTLHPFVFLCVFMCCLSAMQSFYFSFVCVFGELSPDPATGSQQPHVNWERSPLSHQLVG